jgi:hypothetical protein
MRRVSLAAFLLAALAASKTAWAEAVIHISPRGEDRASGAANAPIRTLQQLQVLLDGNARISEVVFHDGVYRGRLSLHAPRDGGVRQLAPLLLRAAEGEHPVIDGAEPLRAQKAEPVNGAPGVYRWDALPQDRAGGTAGGSGLIPGMWDATARKRYLLAADLAAVQQFPASYTFAKGVLYFHTFDNRPPAEHHLEIGAVQSAGEGIRIGRSDVTVCGLAARNYLSTMFSSGFCTSEGSQRVTFQRCHASNCSRGFALGGRHIRLLGCRAEDVGCGVVVNAQHVAIEESVLLRGPHDDFCVPMLDPQEDTGIEVYYPSGEEVAVTGCVIKGFQFCGIFFKCDPGTFTVEHNTLVDNAVALGWSPSKGKRILARHNIMLGGAGVVGQVRNQEIVRLEAVGNVLWPGPWSAEASLRKNLECLNAIGHDNVLADPRLAAPEADDFHLLPGSPCAPGGNASGKLVGALGLVAAGFRDTQPPLLDLKEQPRLIALEDGSDGLPLFASSRRDFALRVRAHDAAGQVAQMRLRVGEGPWSDPMVYAQDVPVKLPPDAGTCQVSVRVTDKAGNWSPPASIRVRPAETAPHLVAAPTVRASRYGVVVSFQTDEECYAVGEAGSGPAGGLPLLHSGVAAPGKLGPADCQHVLGVLFSQQDANRPRAFRIRLLALDGRTYPGPAGEFRCDAPPHSYHVAPDGVDVERGGTPSAPWGTPQYAIDRALPGDTVILAPGIFAQGARITRGGAAGAPLVLRAVAPGTSVIDGQHRVKTALLDIDNASDVEIIGLELRWFGTREHSAVRVTASPRVAVRQCRIWNELCWKESRLGGTGVTIVSSPAVTLEDSLLFRLDWAVYLLDSPGARIVHNTFRAFSHGGLMFLGSSVRGAALRNNSLNYYGNYAYEIHTTNPGDLKTFDSDYNNLGTYIRDEFWRKEPGVVANLPPAVGNSKTVAYYVQADATCVKPDNERVPTGDGINRNLGARSPNVARKGSTPDFEKTKGWKGLAMSHYPWVPDTATTPAERAKNLIGLQIGTFEDWQAFSRCDKHSIWADPRQCDVVAFDFRLLPDSPNIGVGERGTTIGAPPAGRERTPFPSTRRRSDGY